jgi:hypothetical protein
VRWSQQQHEQQQQRQQQELAQRAAAAAASAGTFAGLVLAPDTGAAVAAAGTPLEALLLGLAASRCCRDNLWSGSVHGWLRCLDLDHQPVGRAEAAALGRLVCLSRLSLVKCQLDDCCVIDMLLKLGGRLQWLDVRFNPRVTDACLPVLEHFMSSRPWDSARYTVAATGVTQEGLQLYVPHRQQG